MWCNLVCKRVVRYHPTTLLRNVSVVGYGSGYVVVDFVLSIAVEGSCVMYRAGRSCG